jgi:thiol peroxidase
MIRPTSNRRLTAENHTRSLRGTNMTKQANTITFKGDPMTMVGRDIHVGQAAPDFQLTANDLSPRTLEDYAGKTIVLVTVPSLDTPVCDTEARKFNDRAAELGEDVVVLVVSMDLPFAQKRWCGAAGADNVQTLSDYKDANFGRSYGMIEELALLIRSVVVIDPQGKVTYRQVVEEVTDEPDYDQALEAAKQAQG